jgi:hypothetical protein
VILKEGVYFICVMPALRRHRGLPLLRGGRGVCRGALLKTA